MSFKSESQRGRPALFDKIPKFMDSDSMDAQEGKKSTEWKATSGGYVLASEEETAQDHRTVTWQELF